MWLNDNIISVAQKLLQQLCNGKVFGWNSPQCSRREVQEKFPTIPPNSEYIQIFQVANCHWITVSNVNVSGKAPNTDTVSIYDSGLSRNVIEVGYLPAYET